MEPPAPLPGGTLPGAARPSNRAAAGGPPVRVCRFLPPGGGGPRVGAAAGEAAVADLTALGIERLGALLEAPDPRGVVAALAALAPRLPLDEVALLPPVDGQEVWAAGVTYLRSKTARMEESDFSATAYDRVYDAARPEIFFKSTAAKVVGPGGAIGIRADARWNVPEPELALVINSRGVIVGCTIGNDVSSRDIEGENLLYLPQAKTYEDSCALGPWVTLETDEAAIRSWRIGLAIDRDGSRAFTGETGVDQIKRSLAELAGWLFRSQRFPDGAVLLTGTGVVPDESFTLAPGDRVAITISGIGTLENVVRTV